MRHRAALTGLLLLTAAAAMAAPVPPQAEAWHVTPTGRAASSGELIFRITRSDDQDPLVVSVPVILGARHDTVARSIRNSLDSQLPRQSFDVVLAEGASVRVSDEQRPTGFTLELVDSDVEGLNVTVRRANPTALPEVPERGAPPAVPAQPAPATPAPGQAMPEPALLPPEAQSPPEAPPAISMPQPPHSPLAPVVDFSPAPGPGTATISPAPG